MLTAAWLSLRIALRQRHLSAAARPRRRLRAGPRAALLRPHPVRQPGDRAHGDARGGDGHLHAAAVRRQRPAAGRARPRLPHHRHRAHVTFSLAFVAIVVQARLADFDRSLEEAAMDLGATPWTTFLTITLPLIAPALASGWLLAFTLSSRRFDPDPVRRRRAVADPADARLFQRAAGRRSADQCAGHHHRGGRRLCADFFRLADAAEGLRLELVQPTGKKIC